QELAWEDVLPWRYRAHEDIWVIRIAENDFTPPDIEREARPRRVVIATKISANLSKRLKRYPLAQEPDRRQPDDISERVDAAVGCASVARSILGREEFRIVPVPNLAQAQPRQLADLLRPEGEYPGGGPPPSAGKPARA